MVAPLAVLSSLLFVCTPGVAPTAGRVGLQVSNYSLLFKWQGTNPVLRPLLVMSHQDVVPAPNDPNRPWTHDPFSGTVAEGFVWGRGALDVKVRGLGVGGSWWVWVAVVCWLGCWMVKARALGVPWSVGCVELGCGLFR